MLVCASILSRWDWIALSGESYGKSRIGEEDAIRAVGSVYLREYLGQSGEFCSRLGFPSSSWAQGGGGGDAEDQPEMMWQIGGSGVSLVGAAAFSRVIEYLDREEGSGGVTKESVHEERLYHHKTKEKKENIFCMRQIKTTFKDYFFLVINMSRLFNI